MKLSCVFDSSFGKFAQNRAAPKHTDRSPVTHSNILTTIFHLLWVCPRIPQVPPTHPPTCPPATASIRSHPSRGKHKYPSKDAQISMQNIYNISIGKPKYPENIH